MQGSTALLVREEVGRERGEVVRSCIRVPLTSGPVEFEHDDRTAPRLRRVSVGYAVDRTVDGRAPLQRSGAIPDVQREAQGLAVQALRQNDRVWNTFGEVFLHERGRAYSL